MDDVQKIVNDLGANFKESYDNRDVLKNILEEVSSIASDISNREATDKKLFPYIKRAVKAEYLARGSEGLSSLSESGTSSQFEDIIEKMRNNIIKNRLRRLK